MTYIFHIMLMAPVQELSGVYKNVHAAILIAF